MSKKESILDSQDSESTHPYSKSFGKGLDWAASQCFWIRLREVEGDYAWYDCTIIMGHILWHGNSQIHTT